jgi:hypothetical protein
MFCLPCLLHYYCEWPLQKNGKCLGRCGACSGHIINLKQSILETFDIYTLNNKKTRNALEDVVLVAGTQQNLSNLLFFRYLCKNNYVEVSMVLTAEEDLGIVNHETSQFCFEYL